MRITASSCRTVIGTTPLSPAAEARQLEHNLAGAGPTIFGAHVRSHAHVMVGQLPRCFLRQPWSTASASVRNVSLQIIQRELRLGRTSPAGASHVHAQDM